MTTWLAVTMALAAAPEDAAKTIDRGYEARYYRPGWLQTALLKLAQAEPEAGGLEPPPSDQGLEPPPGGEGGLNLEAPELGELPQEGLSAGPLSNLVFGGTLDFRFLFPREMTRGMFMIHVNELFLTTNIGEYISILAEQLLITSQQDLSSPIGGTVGQDHGFVYATISNLPFLPEGMALRLGRIRLKYGIDAKLDAPANPLRDTAYRTIGILSDRAIELSGYAGPIEVVAAVAMGPDVVERDVLGTRGENAGSILAPLENMSRPIYARIGTDFSGLAPNFGLSGFHGETYPVLALDGFQMGDVMLFGGEMDFGRVVLKQRVSLDARWDFRRLRLFAEGTYGRDRLRAGDVTVWAGFGRIDYTFIAEKLIAHLQYDRFSDGRPDSEPIGTGSAALTYYVADGSWIRAFFQGNEGLLDGSGKAYLAGTQLLLAF